MKNTYLFHFTRRPSPLFVTASLMSIGALLPANAQQVKSQPNIIFFMVDDMGWQDTSLPFADSITANNRKYDTPNMERLAAEGMMFTDAYATPISSPSRCSLMTGMNMARHRVTNWTLHRDQMTDGKRDGVTLPDWNYNGIAQSGNVGHTAKAISFVQLLKNAGYHTIHCGKAHWGAIDTPGENPCHFGFDTNITGTAAGGLATYLSERNYGFTKDGKPISPFAIPGLERYWGTGIFATEALTQEAIAALEKAKKYDQPFYLYMSHYAVHVPIDRDMRFYPTYRARGLSEKEAAYASLIAGMDKSLGDLMDWVAQAGLKRETIIIFMSDNGGLASSSYWRDGELYTQNAPLKSGKGSLYEGGIRVPFIVKWNHVVKPNSRSNTPIIIEDLYPTLLSMAGIKHYHVPQTIDGKDITPILRGRQQGFEQRQLVWNYPNIWDGEGLGISLNCAIREGKWKLIYSYLTGNKELYDLSTDLSENHDLAPSHPKLVAHLFHHLITRLHEMKAQQPIVAHKKEAYPQSQ